MRPLAVVVIALLTAAAASHGDPGKGAMPDRIAALVRQLGHRSFAKREEASRDLAAIGEPARPALTTATADPDPETARRARQGLDGLDARALVAAAKKELDRWQGEGTGNGSQKFIGEGDRWGWGQAGS